MSLCSHCVSGVVHEGTPAGEYTKFGETEVYVATPKKDYPKDKALVILTDIFGIRNIPNACLLADSFAANGLLTYVPDLFHGGSAPANALEPDSGFDLGAWLGKYGPPTAIPVIEGVLSKLKSDGITSIAALGTCYGAKPAFELAKEFKVLAVAHPSFLAVPEDITKIGETGVPVLFVVSAYCETDFMFGKEKQEETDKILGGKSTYKRTYHPGQTHGFLVRGPESSKEAREKGFKEIYEWVSSHL